MEDWWSTKWVEIEGQQPTHRHWSPIKTRTVQRRKGRLKNRFYAGTIPDQKKTGCGFWLFSSRRIRGNRAILHDKTTLSWFGDDSGNGCGRSACPFHVNDYNYNLLDWSVRKALHWNHFFVRIQKGRSVIVHWITKRPHFRIFSKFSFICLKSSETDKNSTHKLHRKWTQKYINEQFAFGKRQFAS